MRIFFSFVKLNPTHNKNLNNPKMSTNAVKTVTFPNTGIDLTKSNNFTVIAVNGAGDSLLSNVLTMTASTTGGGTTTTTGAPSLPEKAAFNYVTDASGNATIIIEITEASGAPAVTNYQFASGNFTDSSSSGGWSNFPSTTTPGVYTFSTSLITSSNITGYMYLQSKNSVGSTCWYGTSASPSKIRYPSAAPTTAVVTPADSSAIIAYSGGTDNFRLNFAYRVNADDWANTTSATTHTVLGLVNGTTYQIKTASSWTDATNYSFFKAYRYASFCIDDVLITPKNGAPVLSALVKTGSNISFTITTAVAAGVQSPLQYEVLLNGEAFDTFNA